MITVLAQAPIAVDQTRFQDVVPGAYIVEFEDNYVSSLSNHCRSGRWRELIRSHRMSLIFTAIFVIKGYLHLKD